jgi:hypothetical protein
MKFLDITNQRFGKLTVVSFDHRQKTSGGFIKYYWKCKCDCGKIKVIRKSHLISGKISSCGCLSNRQGKDSPHFKGYEEITGGYYNSLKKGATDRGRNFKFSVSLEYLWNLFLKQNRRCALTGWDIVFDKRRGSKQTASLDRINSSKGYVKGNVQWVHKDVNLMKNNYNQNRFIQVCKSVANYYKSDMIN